MRSCAICHEPRLDGSYPADVHVCRACELTRHHADIERLTPEKFVGSSGWRLAKTMLDNPHQYTVRDLSSPDAHGTTAMGHEEFEWFAKMITDSGEPNVWWGRTYRYLYVGGWFYWTMGLAPEMTTIINRKATSAAAQAILDKQVEGARRQLEKS